MILPFSTQIKGEPTFFPEKIISALLKIYEETGYRKLEEIFNFIYDFGEKQGYNSDSIVLHCIENSKPKFHTIREDKNERWKPGVMIDFFINARQKNMFRFAPRIPVFSVQKIEIKYSLFNIDNEKKLLPAVWIDDELFYDYMAIYQLQMEHLAINDGFESLDDFFAYFDKDFKGKIIHWTDLKY